MDPFSQWMTEVVLTANTKKPWKNVIKCKSEEDLTYTVIIDMHTYFSQSQSRFGLVVVGVFF